MPTAEASTSIGAGRYAIEEWLSVLAAVPDVTLAEVEAGAWQTGATDRDLAIATALNIPLPVGMATTTDVLNVRDRPGTSGVIKGALIKGKTVNVWGIRGKWRLIRVDALWGWAHGDWLR